jgi:hypothetical protein
VGIVFHQKKKFILILILVILVSFVFLFTSSFSPFNEVEKEKVMKTEEIQKAKQAVDRLLFEMIEENEKYDAYRVEFEKEWNEQNIPEVRIAATNAYEQALKLKEYYSNYHIPVEVPEHILSLFEGLESDLSVAFSTRADAFMLFLAYLDSKDDAKLHQAEVKWAEADDYFVSGSENIKLIQQQMGLVMEKKE